MASSETRHVSGSVDVSSERKVARVRKRSSMVIMPNDYRARCLLSSPVAACSPLERLDGMRDDAHLTFIEVDIALFQAVTSLHHLDGSLLL